MEDLYLNLSEHEFSKGRKALLWIFGSIFILIGFWDLYLKIFKLDSFASTEVTIVSFSIGILVYILALLASSKRKEHYFKVDSNTISYRFGLIAPAHKKIDWKDVKAIYVPKKQKNAIVSLNSGAIININLSWVEKNKSRRIRKYIYHLAKEKSIETHKKHPKKA